MNPMANKWMRSLSIVFLLGLAVGCTSQQPLSNYARTGDTVAVAIAGTEESNALVDILKKDEIAVTLTDSAGAVHPVKLRNLFRVYGDYSSAYMHRAHTRDGFDSSVPAYMGQWMAVVDLVDPSTDAAPTLALGAATMNFSAPSQLNPTMDYPGYGWTWPNGNLSAVPLEILPGTGAPNPLNYQQPVSFSPIDALEPLTQILVEPSGTSSGLIGGGSFTFVYDPSQFGSPLKAVPAGHDPYVQFSSSYTTLENGTRMLKVIVMNPNGFLPDNNLRESGPLSRKSPLKSLRFNLVWDGITHATNVTDANWQNAIQLVPEQSGYIDIDGNSMSQLTPVMAKTH